MTPSSRWLVSVAAVLLALPLVAAAQQTTDADASGNGGWSGSGELGYALSRGNSHTENLNAKLHLKKETAVWKDVFYLTGLRSKGDVTVINAQTGETTTEFRTTANRYEAGASVGYKFDPRRYLVTAARYEHDQFGANIWQGVVSVGYGYIVLKNAQTELSFEIGPGYKRYRPAPTTKAINGEVVTIESPVQHEVIGRGLVNWKWQFTPNTKLEDTFLMEAGSKNKYYQNDLGLSVSMTKKLALKIGFQVRYNSNTPPGTESTDQLYTTNLVYNF